MDKGKLIMESNKIIKGALLLTLAGLISKILSAGYRVPLQNFTGDIGFYIYQQVYPLLGIALVLALYGFPSAISRLMEESKGSKISFQKLFIPLLIILGVINGLIFIVLFSTAEILARGIGDEQLAPSYQVVAFIFLFIPITALLRGIFQGKNDMYPTAYSQVSEQLFRVFIIITAAVYINYQGLDIYKIGEAAGLASIIGAIIAIITLLAFVIIRKPLDFQPNSKPIPWGRYMKAIVFFGFIASLNHMILLVMQFADAFTLVPNLLDYGLAKLDAMEAKGVFDRGQPLIQLGTVLGSSFSLALIPIISHEKRKENPNQFDERVRSSLSVSFYLALGATIGLITIFPQTNLLLFQGLEGTTSLRILALTILFGSTAITGASIIQGLGKLKVTARFIFVVFLIKWLLNNLLVPILGIVGSALATLISIFLLCIFVLIELHRQLPGLQLLTHLKWKSMVIASGGMVFVLQIINLIGPNYLNMNRTQLLFYVLAIVTIGAVLYLFLLIRSQAFTQRELSMLPFASKLQMLFRRKDDDN